VGHFNIFRNCVVSEKIDCSIKCSHFECVEDNNLENEQRFKKSHQTVSLKMYKPWHDHACQFLKLTCQQSYMGVL